VTRQSGWEDNVKMEIRCEGTEWTELLQNRDQWQHFVNTVPDLWVSGEENGKFLDRLILNSR
jgi:hypothetical protein